MGHVGLFFGPTPVFLLSARKPKERFGDSLFGVSAAAEFADDSGAVGVADWIVAQAVGAGVGTAQGLA